MGWNFGNINKPSMRSEGTMSGRQARAAVSARGVRGGPPSCQHPHCTSPARVLDNKTGHVWCMSHKPTVRVVKSKSDAKSKGKAKRKA